MKTSVITGEIIYKTMAELYQKQRSLTKAVDQVAKEIGAGSEAFVFLKEDLDRIQREIKQTESIEYTMSPTIPRDYEPKAPSGYYSLPAAPAPIQGRGITK